MSDDLISRQAALYELHLLSIEALKKHRFDYDALITICSKKLKNLPSFQPKQKTGRWEHDCGHFANRWICSQCGYKFYFEKSEAKYCPNCGAKMESEEKQ